MNPILLSVANVEIQAAAGDGQSKTPRVSILAYTGGTMRPPGWPELASTWRAPMSAGKSRFSPGILRTWILSPDKGSPK